VSDHKAPQQTNILVENARLRAALRRIRKLVAALPECNVRDGTAMSGVLKDKVTQTLQNVLTTLATLKDIE
jgi:hypothetical protein